MEWISVKERLPDLKQRVLVWCPYWSNEPFCAFMLYEDRWEADRILHHAPEGDPTHWMPLPDPPKE